MLVALLLSAPAALEPIPARADVVRDGRIGTAGAGSVATESDGSGGLRYLIGEADGQRAGDNLYHSFSRMDLLSNETAVYQGAPEIRNLITTITGGRSSIDGKIVSEIDGANLFLINADGIRFGEHARFDVSGSLRVATAEQLVFSNGERVETRGTAPPPLLSIADPVGFGFLDAPAAIEVHGSRIEVAADRSIAFVGGDLTFSGQRSDALGGVVNAPSGRIDLVSLASAGDVALEAAGIQTNGITRYGDIGIVDDFVLSTSGLGVVSPLGGVFTVPRPVQGSGPIFVRADDLLIRDAQVRTLTVTSEDAGVFDATLTGTLAIEGGPLGVQTGIFADTGFNLPPIVPAPPTPDFFQFDSQLNVLIGVWVCGGTVVCGVQYQNSGRAGDVVIHARDVLLTNGGKIRATSEFAGNAGKIDIDFQREMVIAGRRGPGDTSQLSTNANAPPLTPSGNPGRIVVHSQNGLLRMDDHGSIVIQNGVDGGTLPTAAGLIQIDVGSLDMTRDARIDSSIRGAGTGGFLDIRARDRIRLSGSGGPGSFTGISTLAQPGSSGPAGQIVVTTRVLEIDDGAEISSRPADATAIGSAGELRFTLGDRLVMNGGTISTQSSSFEGGNIGLSVGRLVHLRGSSITTSVTQGPASGGNITLRPGPQALVLEDSRIVAGADAGRGGDIDLEAGLILVAGASTISAASQRGVDGEVLINGVEGNIVPEVAQLATPAIDTSSLLREPCAARTPGASNRFVVDERARISLDASDYLAAPIGGLLAALPESVESADANRARDERSAEREPARPGSGNSMMLARIDALPPSDCTD